MSISQKEMALIKGVLKHKYFRTILIFIDKKSFICFILGCTYPNKSCVTEAIDNPPSITYFGSTRVI